jgi:hypothetical protein
MTMDKIKRDALRRKVMLRTTFSDDLRVQLIELLNAADRADIYEEALHNLGSNPKVGCDENGENNCKYICDNAFKMASAIK